MFVVGLTGGIASGKSLIARIFHLLGVSVYIADIRAKYLIRTDQSVKKNIIDTFGLDAYKPDGSYNTNYIGDIIFNEADAMQKINNIVHPAVRADFEVWKNMQKSPYVLHEAAILFEAGLAPQMDKIIIVTAPEAIRVERVMRRDGLERESAIKRIKSQMPELEKIKMSDYQIKNEGGALLVEKCLEIHFDILNILNFQNK